MVAVTHVETMEDYRLLLIFDNGEKRIFDIKPYLSHGIFSQLADRKMFETARLSFDTVQWDNGADLCPEVLYSDSASCR